MLVTPLRGPGPVRAPPAAFVPPLTLAEASVIARRVHAGSPMLELLKLPERVVVPGPIRNASLLPGGRRLQPRGVPATRAANPTPWARARFMLADLLVYPSIGGEYEWRSGLAIDDISQAGRVANIDIAPARMGSVYDAIIGAAALLPKPEPINAMLPEEFRV